MAKNGTYNGGGSVFTVHLTGHGCKARRSKLGGLQIAAKRFAENPPAMFPLYPADAKIVSISPGKKKRRKFPSLKGRRILE